VPFSLLIDAVDDYLADLEERKLMRLCGPELSELTMVFPAVSAVAERPREGLQEERYVIHRAVRRLLQRVARERPLVLALDDVQWADPASVELLAHVLRRPTQAPMLVAIAVRSGQLPSSLSAALDGRDREGSGTRLALAPAVP
jgi:predicted ATPase